MGPATETTKTKGSLDPPFYKPDGDQLERRRKVARWVELIASAASKGTDKQYQTVFATLGRQLYDKGLPGPQQSHVDRAQKTKRINFKQDDQFKAVVETVDLIADEQPISIVTRRITSFNKVISCKRRKNEELQSFVSRFQGLAADHLRLAGTSSTSQMGEVFAITLLNNTELSDSGLSNAKLELVNMAKSRIEKEGTESDSKSVSTSLLHRIEKICSDLFNLVNNVTTRGSTADAYKTLANQIVRRALHISNRLDEATINLSKPDGSSEPEDRISQLLFSGSHRYTLHLDDAVSVLKSLSLSTKTANVSLSKSDIEDIVGKRVQKAFLSLNKSSNQDSQSFPNTSKKHQGSSSKQAGSSKQTPTKQSAQGNKSLPKRKRDPGFCMDCGLDKHRRGDDDCESPSFMTKKLRTEREGYQGESKQQNRFFQSGSNHTKNNRD